MRKLIALLLTTFALTASAQELDGSPLFMTSGLVRSYPLDHSGTMDPSGAVMWMDFEQTVAGTVTSSDGGYTFSVTGTPTKVTDGTWPEGLSGSQGHGWKFTGSQHLSRAYDGTFSPSGDFSYVFIAAPDSVSTVYDYFS